MKQTMWLAPKDRMQERQKNCCSREEIRQQLEAAGRRELLARLFEVKKKLPRAAWKDTQTKRASR